MSDFIIISMKGRSIMKSWVQFAVLCMSVSAVGIGGRSAHAKGTQVISKVYGAVTSAPLLKPSPVKSSSSTTIDIVLKPTNTQELYKQAMAVNTPGDSQFRNYLTPSGIRNAYGQSKSVTNSWKAYLSKHHLSTFVYDNGIILSVSGKAKYIDKLFKVDMNHATYHSNPLQFGKSAPRFPAQLQKSVYTVLGMGDHNRKFVIPDADVQMIDKTKRVPNNMYDLQSFAKDYNAKPLYQQGLTGKGQTVGIIAFGNVVKSNVFHFWKSQGASTNKNRLSVESVPTSVFKNGFVSKDESETTMDAEYAGAVAPQANVKVYLENSPLATFTNTINAYSTVFNENKVGSVSNSWGIGPNSISQMLVKRRVLTPKYLQVLNLVLAQGALQGISNFTASGDTGALINTLRGVSGNQGLLDRATTDSDPISSSPWITSCGGTIPASTHTIKTPLNLGKVTIPKERAWGSDWAWNSLKSQDGNTTTVLKSIHGFGGSGGGFSHLEATPSYQQGVPGVNTFNAREYISNLAQPVFDTPLMHGTDTGRNYPDVSANAGGLNGYLMYQKEKGESPWTGGAGTSIVAPQYAGMTALINSEQGRPRMGFWNAEIYRLAQQSDSPFHPLNDTTDNSNLFYTGQPGTVYNQASGLGTTDFAKLAEVYK
ncbi:S53 family peptidase [Lentilactobacillus buchneri]|nr:S53 family serine peptidase [Lentilactobacillus buchneri]